MNGLRIALVLDRFESSLGGLESVRELVARRVFLLHCDSDLLFALVRPNQTLGHFRYDDSSTVLTQRLAFEENEAWDEIESMVASSPMIQLFTVAVRDALRQAA